MFSIFHNNIEYSKQSFEEAKSAVRIQRQLRIILKLGRQTVVLDYRSIFGSEIPVLQDDGC